jgi:hypothetical protein
MLAILVSVISHWQRQESPSVKSISNWKTYVSEEGFSIKYPEDYVVVKNIPNYPDSFQINPQRNQGEYDYVFLYQKLNTFLDTDLNQGKMNTPEEWEFNQRLLDNSHRKIRIQDMDIYSSKDRFGTSYIWFTKNTKGAHVVYDMHWISPNNYPGKEPNPLYPQIMNTLHFEKNLEQ